MPVPEAPLREAAGALEPDGPGWFVMNVADALAQHSPAAGKFIRFESDEHRFPHFGIGVHMLRPGEPNAKYHAESGQEGFLVLEGQCRLIVEGEERILEKWDYFHCAPMTRHITIGAGDDWCAILMVGARPEHEELEYPKNELAAKYGAESPEETSDPKVAYSQDDWEWTPGRLGWPVD